MSRKVKTSSSRGRVTRTDSMEESFGSNSMPILSPAAGQSLPRGQSRPNLNVTPLFEKDMRGRRKAHSMSPRDMPNAFEHSRVLKTPPGPKSPHYQETESKSQDGGSELNLTK